MPALRLLFVGCLAALLASCTHAPAASPAPPNAAVFIGATPSGSDLLTAFGIPSDADSFVHWRLTLHRNPTTQQPAGYEVRFESETTVSGLLGNKQQTHTTEHRGNYSIGSGRANDPHAVIIKLDDLLSMAHINDDVLHLLNPDRTLRVGTGGWSYSLNRETAAEPPVQEADVVFPPNDSYSLTPLATGPDVFGIFVGRSPIARIWRQFRRPEPLDSIKAKWRLTLFKDPATGAPTTYRIDGTMYRAGLMKDPKEPREGTWTISEHQSTKTVVYELGPWQSEPGLKLLVGDENVLFFLDGNDKLLVGSANFSYTLNRRPEAQESAATKP